MKKRLVLLLVLLSMVFIGNVKADDTVYDEYKVGDLVELDGVRFYVIAPSDNDKNYVTLLKEKALTYEEIGDYSAIYGDHINAGYSGMGIKTLHDGVTGGVAYYSSSMCRTVDQSAGCRNKYFDADATERSDVSYIVNTWASHRFSVATDVLDGNVTTIDGYYARLITRDELIENLGYNVDVSTANGLELTDDVPSWVYDNDYSYWTMSSIVDDNSHVSVVMNNGNLHDFTAVYDFNKAIRPVVNANKKYVKLISKTEDDITDKIVVDNDSEDKSNSDKVNVENTFLSKSLIPIIIGIGFVVIGTVIYVFNKKKK